MMMEKLSWLILVVPLMVFIGCKNPHKQKKFNTGSSTVDSSVHGVKEPPKYKPGVGPVKHRIQLPDSINHSMAAKGKKLFYNNCASCHRMHQDLTGPALGGVLEERSPQFVMNMILNPEGMLKNNPEVQAMRGEYGTDMVDTHLSKKEARAIVEYFRSL